MPSQRPRMTQEQIRTEFPAKYSRKVMDEITLILEQENIDNVQGVHTVFDPFGGVGGIHVLRDIGYLTYAIEIEREWAALSPYTYIGNALDPKAVKTIKDRCPFDALCWSPSYGNRMADHHHAGDECAQCEGVGSYPPFTRQLCDKCGGSGLSRRNTYAHRLRAAASDETRELHVDNSGGMQWSDGPAGDEYRDFHRKVYRKLPPMLRHGGLMILNTSDHKRDGDRKKVNGFHIRTLCDLGMEIEDVCPIVTRRNRNGANAGVRVDGELLTVLRKP